MVAGGRTRWGMLTVVLYAPQWHFHGRGCSGGVWVYRGRVTITLVLGDITQQRTDAIVNAADSSLLGGGGVDGAIHRRGGPAILQACRELRADAYRDGLSVGQAIATTAGELPARWVIHTVRPVYQGAPRPGAARRIVGPGALSVEAGRSSARGDHPTAVALAAEGGANGEGWVGAFDQQVGDLARRRGGGPADEPPAERDGRRPARP